MKREELSDLDTMSGMGWYLDDGEDLVCPACGEALTPSFREKNQCYRCKAKLKIRYGVQHLIKVEVKE